MRCTMFSRDNTFFHSGQCLCSYSSHLAPESQQPIKRPDMSSEPGQESHPDSPRPNGRHSRRSRSRSVDKPHTRCPIWVTMLLLTLVGFVGFYTGQPSESEHNHIRERWEAERQNHEIEVEKWHKDRDARLAQETGEIDRFKREEHNLVVRKQEMIADYTLKEERWLQKMDSYQAKEKDIIRRQEEMENLYHAKEQAWRQKIASFEDEWQRMIDNENRKRERARLYWDDIQGDEYCLANGRKKYTARLANLTPSLDSMEACKFTSITLNGVTYDRPISCENTRSHGVRGHWIADNEGICAAYWEYVKIKECTAPQSGYRVSPLSLTYFEILIMTNLPARTVANRIEARRDPRWRERRNYLSHHSSVYQRTNVQSSHGLSQLGLFSH
ncbi:hypothetical protein H2248_011340 [Termitomyces sp. 'cryptogamus']|nr:hypothetical protein H2248_011340 [Termitomyces sp. 'cryptogamus']